MKDTVTRTFDLLERAQTKFPGNNALGGKKNGEWYTYTSEEYAEKSHQLAIGLLALGLKKGDKVVTVTANRPEWSIADMAMGLTGIWHVPIYPTLGEDEYKYILMHAGAKMIFVGNAGLYKKILPLAESLKITLIYTFDEVAGVKNYQEILDLGESEKDGFLAKLQKIKEAIKPDDVATLIYTSGTTGVPKGVMLTHKNLVSNFKAHSKAHVLGVGHRALSFLPLCHVYERSMNYHFQYKGMCVYYVGALSQIMKALKEVKPHMFNTVPRLLEKIYDGFVGQGKTFRGLKKKLYFWALNLTQHFEYNKKFGFLMRFKIKVADKLIYSKWREALGGNVSHIVSGGAALRSEIARTLGMAKIYSFEGYGLTETSPVIAVNLPIKHEVVIGTVGPALEGTELKIADDGEILCKGPGVMKGYYNAPELTDEVIDKDGWFHTGDIGTFVEGKYLKITDRKKEIFKLSGGKYIAPQMIENKLKTSDYIEQVMVIGENEKFASALISPNFPHLHDWAADNKIRFEDNDELIGLPEIIALVQGEVAGINKTLGGHEQISRIRLVCEEWTPASGELSPTLKLRRNTVAQKYKELIDDIYSVAR